jgi:hypothetical protein
MASSSSSNASPFGGAEEDESGIISVNKATHRSLGTELTLW